MALINPRQQDILGDQIQVKKFQTWFSDSLKDESFTADLITRIVERGKSLVTLGNGNPLGLVNPFEILGISPARGGTAEQRKDAVLAYWNTFRNALEKLDPSTFIGFSGASRDDIAKLRDDAREIARQCIAAIAQQTYQVSDWAALNSSFQAHQQQRSSGRIGVIQGIEGLQNPLQDNPNLYLLLGFGQDFYSEIAVSGTQQGQRIFRSNIDTKAIREKIASLRSLVCPDPNDSSDPLLQRGVQVSQILANIENLLCGEISRNAYHEKQTAVLGANILQPQRNVAEGMLALWTRSSKEFALCINERITPERARVAAGRGLYLEPYTPAFGVDLDDTLSPGARAEIENIVESGRVGTKNFGNLKQFQRLTLGFTIGSFLTGWVLAKSLAAKGVWFFALAGNAPWLPLAVAGGLGFLAYELMSIRCKDIIHSNVRGQIHEALQAGTDFFAIALRLKHARDNLEELLISAPGLGILKSLARIKYIGSVLHLNWIDPEVSVKDIDESTMQPREDPQNRGHMKYVKMRLSDAIRLAMYRFDMYAEQWLKAADDDSQLFATSSAERANAFGAAMGRITRNINAELTTLTEELGLFDNFRPFGFGRLPEKNLMNELRSLCVAYRQALKICYEYDNIDPNTLYNQAQMAMQGIAHLDEQGELTARLWHRLFPIHKYIGSAFGLIAAGSTVAAFPEAMRTATTISPPTTSGGEGGIVPGGGGGPASGVPVQPNDFTHGGYDPKVQSDFFNGGN